MDRFFKRPWLIVAVIGLITLFFSLQLLRVEIDNNNINFLPADDPAVILSERIDDLFGGSLSLIVGLERPYGTVFDPGFLADLKGFVEALEEIPLVSQINSFISMDYITGRDGGIVITGLMEKDWGGTAAEVAELKRRLASWPLMQTMLVSEDLTSTMITITFPLPQSAAVDTVVAEAVAEIREAARCFDDQTRVYWTGYPLMISEVTAALVDDLTLLVPLVILVVLGVLFFSFRRLSGIVLPLLTVIVAVIWTVGLMPLFQVKMTVISTLVPVILVAVGSAYGIHVVTHYFHDMTNRLLTPEEHRDLVFALIRKIMKPVFLAALTTFGGFISFLFASVTPMRNLGVFAAVGVMIAFAVAVTLIPALLLIRGPRKTPLKEKKAAAEDRLSLAIGGAFFAASRKRGLVIFICALGAVLSFSGLSKLIIDNVMLEYFNPKAELVRSDRFIGEKFTGSTVIDIILEAESSEVLLAPDVLGPLDKLMTFLNERVPEVGAAVGFTDMIKRINQVWNAEESPAGLTRQAGGNSGPGNFGFGDGGDFALGEAGAGDGLGDFGFGDFGLGESGGESGLGDFGFAGWEEEGGHSGGDAGRLEADLGGETWEERLKNYGAADWLAMLDTAAGKTAALSGTELVRDLERQINYQGLAYYEIPTDPERYGKTTPQELQSVVANYLAMLAGSLTQYANDSLEPTVIRSQVMLRSASGRDINRVQDFIRDFVQANFPPAVTVSLSGGALVQNALNSNIVNSQITSLVAAIFIVFLIIAISNRSLAAGLIGALPLALSILASFGVMGFTGIKLNMGTAMMASLTVGIGVDYTIHYLEAFKREFRALKGGEGFLRRSFADCGKAILINAVSVGGGFLVLIFSNLNFLGEMGILIALSMGLSALLSLTIIPVLLEIIKPKFIYQGA
ncbi:MAG: MMPL family transporter [Spirochaetales bacterium]|jgi:predicted RND superfamily exporter protein|nr:MMPL family transporter [Spirochaetales bacterium]